MLCSKHVGKLEIVTLCQRTHQTCCTAFLSFKGHKHVIFQHQSLTDQSQHGVCSHVEVCFIIYSCFPFTQPNPWKQTTTQDQRSSGNRNHCNTSVSHHDDPDGLTPSEARCQGSKVKTQNKNIYQNVVRCRLHPKRKEASWAGPESADVTANALTSTLWNLFS